MITKIIDILKNEGVILYPTDTIYGIGCDATNSLAIEKIYSLKKRSKSKSFIVLVNSFEMLENYVNKIPNLILTYLKTTKKPTTVIYSNPKNLANNIIAKDNTVAIRIVNKGFAFELITAFNKPIVSTSANISSKETPINFELIDKSIKNNVDFIVTLPDYKTKKIPSTIIRLVDNKIELIRK